MGARLAFASRAQAPLPTDRLGAFLQAAGAQDLAQVRLVHGRGADAWRGWTFQAGGCAARAYPLALDGELDGPAQRAVGPSESINYVYRGRIGPHAPTPDRYLAFVAHRVARAFVADRSPDFYVALIAPRDCEAAQRLAWRTL